MCLPLGASAIGIAAIPGDYLAAAQWAVTAQPLNVGTFRAFRDAKRLSDRDCNAGTGGPRGDPGCSAAKPWRAAWNKTANKEISFCMAMRSARPPCIGNSGAHATNIRLLTPSGVAGAKAFAYILFVRLLDRVAGDGFNRSADEVALCDPFEHASWHCG